MNRSILIITILFAATISHCQPELSPDIVTELEKAQRELTQNAQKSISAVAEIGCFKCLYSRKKELGAPPDGMIIISIEKNPTDYIMQDLEGTHILTSTNGQETIELVCKTAPALRLGEFVGIKARLRQDQWEPQIGQNLYLDTKKTIKETFPNRGTLSCIYANDKETMYNVSPAKNSYTIKDLFDRNVMMAEASDTLAHTCIKIKQAVTEQLSNGFIGAEIPKQPSDCQF